MLNKIYKTIHNKYSNFFRFIFFLRYLFAIFFISSATFLIIPNFFDYDQRAETIKNNLQVNYNFKVSKYDKIIYEALPIPKLNFKNAVINFESSPIKLNVENLKVYPKLISLYNYNDFQLNKVVLKNNKIILKDVDLSFINKNYFKKKNKLSIIDLNIEIINNGKSLIKIENLHYTNYGYNKNILKGKVFDNKFTTKISDNFENFDFKLLNSGISAEINFDKIKKNNLIEGFFKSKILNSNLKFNFNYDKKKLNIYKSYFRNKNLSFKNNSQVVIDPFLYVSSEFEIDDVNTKILKDINFKQILKFKDIIKKISSKNQFRFVSKKFNRNLVNDLVLEIDTAHGRLNYKKEFFILESFFRCKGDINFFEDYPRLFFDCIATANDKKKIFKKFNIKSKNENKDFKINVKGSLSIFNNKVNFTKVTYNGSYKATKEDLRYFKESFEKILYNNNIFDIFNQKKIKEFISEIN